MDPWIPVISAVLVVVLPLLTKDWLESRKEAKVQAAKRIEEARKSGMESARAEAYKEQAIATITDLKEENTEILQENVELRSVITRLADHEIPRLQKILDEKDMVIHRLSDSSEVLSDLSQKISDLLERLVNREEVRQ